MDEIKNLLKRDWRFFAGIAVVFIFSILLGSYLQQTYPQLIAKYGKSFFGKFQQLAQLIKGQPVWVEIAIIWLNNIMASLVAIAIGIFLPVFPLLSLIGNGLMIGVVQQIIEAQRGMTMAQFYLGLLPHGIFELPAFFIAVGLGVRLGNLPYRVIWQRHMSPQRKPLIRIFFNETRLYMTLISVMLIVAAVFEVTVSPLLLR
ncbi:MAG TPA: stage II sporulation protein M [Bacillota bacterium]|nr:stage II sporulation protein M [Bacillota bacterium]